MGPNGILKKGREILLTGCSLSTATEGSGKARLLPTEYIVILLDEVTTVLVNTAILNATVLGIILYLLEKSYFRSCFAKS